MNPSCVILPHHAGLFSLVNKVVSTARFYNHVHVDWSEGCIYGDCWADLFEPTTLPEGPHDTIKDYLVYDLTSQCAGVMYMNEGWGWRQQCHEQWLKLGCKIRGDDVPRSTVGVLVRCDNHRGEQLNDRSQTLDEYMQAIDRLDLDRYELYVVTGDEETLSWFVSRGAFFSPSTKRTAKRSDPDRHLTQPQTKEDAIQVMREVMTLANCDYLVHPISNMATASLYINPLQKSIYLK